MISIHQVTTQRQVDVLHRADVLGFCLTREATPGGYALTVEQWEELEVPAHQRIALAFDRAAAYRPAEVAALLDRTGPDFVDLPLGLDDRNARTDLLAVAGGRLVIAHGLLVLPDDLHLLSQGDRLDALAADGVALFRVEVDSWPDLPARRRSELDAFLGRHPCLVTDHFTTLAEYPAGNARGLSLTLATAPVPYDFSDLTVPLSRAARLLRTASRPEVDGKRS